MHPMAATLILLLLLLVATITDWRVGKIFNWTVYPGILLALGANALGSVIQIDERWADQADVLGLVGFGDSLAGFAACGAVMLVCYVLFAGGVGGGDLKLLAMIGAFWGLQRGLEAMLWTLVIGGCLALIRLVWQIGAGRLVAQSAKYVWQILRTGIASVPNEEERRLLKTPLNLAPSAALAVLVVQFQLLAWF